MKKVDQLFFKIIYFSINISVTQITQYTDFIIYKCKISENSTKSQCNTSAECRMSVSEIHELQQKDR